MSTLTSAAIAQSDVKSVDLNKYSGKWYVIASIPTRFDKDWNYATETYTLKENGDIAVFTTYIKEGQTKEKSVKSKGFPDKKTNNVFWQVQFIWPFKADYLIEELAPDYSYVMVGHPKKDFLYIMARNSQMDEKDYNRLVEKARQKGYELKELRKLLQK